MFFYLAIRMGYIVTDRRIISIVEVIVVMILLDLLLVVWNLSGLGQIQIALLYWNYFSHLLFFIVPIIVIIGASRNMKKYGLALSYWRYNIKWGLFLVLIVIVPIMLTVVLGFTLVEGDIDQPNYILSTLIFQFLFAGFGEEVLFRGYYQSRLNEGFSRKFRVFNLEFGWGVFITAILFGMVHVFFWPRLFLGGFQINIMSGIYTGMIGLVLGFVREKSGSILAPSLMHGLWDCTVVFVVQASIFTIISIAAWSVCTIIVLTVFAKTKLIESEQSSDDIQQ